MPRQVKAWGCAFKCGRIGTKKKAIERHELTCMKNPARRACPTCKHDDFAWEDDGTPWGQSFKVYYCKIDKRPEFQPKPEGDIAPKRECRMIYNCEHWERE